MPDHTIFNERPESQDRALKVIERLGYTIVPRSEAERKRGSRKAVLFTEELQTFLSGQTYQFGSETRYFSGGYRATRSGGRHQPLRPARQQSTCRCGEGCARWRHV